MPPITPSLQNWTIVPVANPEKSRTEQMLMVLSGIATVDLRGVDTKGWRTETVVITPDAGPAMTFAQTAYAVKTFPPQHILNGTPEFKVEQWAPFVAVGPILDEDAGKGPTGFAVTSWRLYRPTGAADPIFSGIEVDLAVLNTTAVTVLGSVSYNITLVGTIHVQPPVNNPHPASAGGAGKA
jgi:hypothetical protein